MLSSENIRRINRQIADELRVADSITKSDEQKAAALDRALKLKELLAEDETPSRKSILKELATAILEAREESRERNRPVDIFDSIFGIRR
jgi:hypothetical protein